MKLARKLHQFENVHQMITVLHKGRPANDYGSTDYGSLLPEQIQTGQDGYIQGMYLSNNMKSSFCNSCYVFFLPSVISMGWGSGSVQPSCAH